VTANRREQNVLDVPYNISAVSGQALQAANITSLTDIAGSCPASTYRISAPGRMAATATSSSAA